MKAREMVMITTITNAVELTISPAGKQPKSVIKAVERSAKKLAHKLIRTQKQEKKILDTLPAKKRIQSKR